MSKISDAIKRAQHQRDGQSSDKGHALSERLKALREEFAKEMREVEAAFSKRRSHATQPVDTASPSTDPVIEVYTPPTPAAVALSMTASPSVAPAPPAVTQDAPKPSEATKPIPIKSVSIGAAKDAVSASPQRCDQAVQHIREELVKCEQQVARQHGERSSIEAKLEAHDHVAVQVEQERLALRRLLEHTTQDASSIEAARAGLKRQLDALRDSQILSHAVKIAEDELRANAAMIEQIGRSQQRLAAEMAYYQERAAAVKQQAEELQVRLAQTLSQAGMSLEPS
jgi:chromosome segregation ATPase